MSGPMKMLLGVMGTGSVTFVGLCAFAVVEAHGSKAAGTHGDLSAAAKALRTAEAPKPLETSKIVGAPSSLKEGTPKAPEKPLETSKIVEGPTPTKAESLPKVGASKPATPAATDAQKHTEPPSKAAEAPGPKKAPTEVPKIVDAPKAAEASKAAEDPKAVEVPKTAEGSKAKDIPKAAEGPKAADVRRCQRAQRLLKPQRQSQRRAQRLLR
eukprot:TRINITY_DN16553_c0_g1_i1.p1 TRINITY_DN16553_c0_g1~~TRINITY_DN16553_c0_g1_i1.p1  ORF type:complete len:224 (-),score=24.88 TRINITY_DN16553_c0_g1_i1:157-792(-)